MSFFKKPETQVKINSSKSIYTPKGMHQILVNLMDETYNKIQLKKIELNKTGTEIIEECLILSMDFLEPKRPVTAEKNADFMKDQAVTSAMKIEPAKKITGKVAEKKSARISNGWDVNFNIETNVPPPSGVVKSGKGVPIIKKMQKTLRLMKSEDSVVVPNKELSLRFQKIARAKNIVIRCRRQADNTYRCWRI